MALVTTVLQQKHCLEIEERSYKMKSESGISAWDSWRVFMFLLGRTVAGFGGNWKIDASNEENEEPYL